MIQKHISRLVYMLRLTVLKRYLANANNLNSPVRVISGSPRGGTTWLYEVIEKNSSGFGIWEPLHPKSVQDFYKDTNQWFHKFVPANEKNYELEKYFTALLKGEFITESLLQKNSKFRTYKSTSFLLQKYCRLSPLLPWFNHHFPNVKVVHMYRNPLAVVSSQMRHGAWNYKKEYNGYELTGLEYYPAYYKQFEEILSTIKFPEEVLAANWALDMIPTLLNRNDDNILYIKYEDLFLSSEMYFPQVFEFFNLPIPKDLSEIITKPSSTTKQGSNIIDNPEKQLETWKKYLTEEQVERVRGILSQFGFSQIGDIEYKLELNRKVEIF